jgi:hypothetical protein
MADNGAMSDMEKGTRGLLIFETNGKARNPFPPVSLIGSFPFKGVGDADRQPPAFTFCFAVDFASCEISPKNALQYFLN